MSVPVPDTTILGILAARPQHGYELLNHFRENSELGRVWTLSTSQLYAVLKRLEREKLVRGKTVASPEAPARREYRVTKPGNEVVQSWLFDSKLSPSIRQVRVQFISRLYVARLLGAPVGEIIAKQRNACVRQREAFIKQKSQVDSEMEELTLDFVIGQLGAVLDWLDSCEKKLRRPARAKGE
jgi:DNA-binding PadR family transcriptional regulator